MCKYGFKKSCLLIFMFFLALLIGSTVVYAQTWQETLEQNFDIVETFDQLQDWRGLNGYHLEPELMPKKLDGSPSIWNFYSSDAGGIEDWIKNHGEDYVWNGLKSACVNLRNLGTGVSGDIGYGASRYSTFFGDGVSSKSGYKKIHVFYMVKFRPGYFGKEPDGSYAYIMVIKHIELCSGFTENRYWGTPAEHVLACDNPQVKNEYGPNYSINNFSGGGLSYPHNLN